MEITALVSFGALLVAWIVAPSSSTVASKLHLPCSKPTSGR